MVLQDQEIFGRLGRVFRCLRVRGDAHDLLPIVQQDAVQEYGEISGLYKFLAFEFGRLEDDVVVVPLAGLVDGVHQRGPLAVDGSGLAVGVGGVLIRVEDLQFVAALENDSAIAAVLADAVDLGRSRPFQVQLNIAKGFLGGDVAGYSEEKNLLFICYNIEPL